MYFCGKKKKKSEQNLMNFQISLFSIKKIKINKFWKKRKKEKKKPYWFCPKFCTYWFSNILNIINLFS